jgi:hypothetical protein
MVNSGNSEDLDRKQMAISTIALQPIKPLLSVLFDCRLDDLADIDAASGSGTAILGIKLLILRQYCWRVLTVIIN